MTAGDEHAIHSWPSYPAEFKDLDYALREKGWLAQFPAGPTNDRIAARVGNHLVGFSILTKTGLGEAEFYIALHPESIGRGLGKIFTRMVVQQGFEQLKLQKIHLKVRSWHLRAIQLYEGLGFRQVGAKDLEINGKREQFIIMELDKLADHTS